MKKYKNLILNAIYIILGIVLLVLACIEKVNNLFAGFGGGLIGVGAVQLVRSIKYLTNKDYRQKIDIENNDERNRYISMKAWSFAGYAFVIICAVLLVVFLIMNKMLYIKLISIAICALILLYTVFYYIFKNKN